MPADLTLSTNGIALAVVGLIITALGYHAVVGNYIRREAGVKETQRVEITGQPIIGRHEPRHVQVHEHDVLKASMESRFSEMWEVVNGLRLDISDVKEHTATIAAMREANGARLSEISTEVREVAKSVNTLSGIVQAKWKGANS